MQFVHNNCISSFKFLRDFLANKNLRWETNYWAANFGLFAIAQCCVNVPRITSGQTAHNQKHFSAWMTFYVSKMIFEIENLSYFSKKYSKILDTLKWPCSIRVHFEWTVRLGKLCLSMFAICQWISSGCRPNRTLSRLSYSLWRWDQADWLDFGRKSCAQTSPSTWAHTWIDWVWGLVRSLRRTCQSQWTYVSSNYLSTRINQIDSHKCLLENSKVSSTIDKRTLACNSSKWRLRERYNWSSTAARRVPVSSSWIASLLRF